MTEDLATRVRRLERQIRAFKELHTQELQLLLDELASIAEQVEAEATALEPAHPAPPADPADPAAASPKRAKWLAGQERKNAPKSRRELILPRRDE